MHSPLSYLTNFRAITFSSCLVSLLATNVLAQSDETYSVEAGTLPQPIIKTENCVVNDSGWGWDGEQSCYPGNTWFYGASQPLSKSRGDINGDNLAWSRSDVLNKTVRCDSYRYNYRSAYTKETYDITFLDPDNTSVDQAVTDFPEATAHIFTNGWRIVEFGQLQGTIFNFNGYEFTTDDGFIFVSDFNTDDNKSFVREFNHCYLRDESAPLRASGYCVDYDGDGIGWNGTESCSVVTTDPDCDYGTAHDGYNQGWGYNPVSGQSCPPLADSSSFIPEDTCSQVGSDGWGWNRFRQQSCRIE